MQYITPNPFRTGYDLHKSTPNQSFLNTLPPKVPGGRGWGKSPNTTQSMRSARRPKENSRTRTLITLGINGSNDIPIACIRTGTRVMESWRRNDRSIELLALCASVDGFAIQIVASQRGNKPSLIHRLPDEIDRKGSRHTRSSRSNIADSSQANRCWRRIDRQQREVDSSRGLAAELNGAAAKLNSHAPLRKVAVGRIGKRSSIERAVGLRIARVLSAEPHSASR
jgi:hypothetical protein